MIQKTTGIIVTARNRESTQLETAWEPRRIGDSPDIIPNGCFPSSLIYLQRYLKKNPEEGGCITLLQLIDDLGEEYTHAVAIVTSKGELFAWDQEVGLLSLDTFARQYDHRTLPLRLKPLYNFAVASLRRDIKAGRRAPITSEKISAHAWANRVAGMMDTSMQAVVIEFEEGKQHGTTFVAEGFFWLYVPSIGSTAVTMDRIKSRDELTAEALAKLGLPKIFCRASDRNAVAHCINVPETPVGP